MKYKTEINESMQKELTAKIRLIYKIMMIVGAIGLLAYIICGTILEENTWSELLLVFAIPFGFGLVMLIFLNKQQKAVIDLNQYNEYEFVDDFMNVETFSNNESVSKTKFYYKNIVKIKETENYLFLFIQAGQAFPILKSELSSENKEKLLENINKSKNK